MLEVEGWHAAVEGVHPPGSNQRADRARCRSTLFARRSNALWPVADPNAAAVLLIHRTRFGFPTPEPDRTCDLHRASARPAGRLHEATRLAVPIRLAARRGPATYQAGDRSRRQAGRGQGDATCRWGPSSTVQAHPPFTTCAAPMAQWRNIPFMRQCNALPSPSCDTSRRTADDTALTPPSRRSPWPAANPKRTSARCA